MVTIIGGKTQELATRGITDPGILSQINALYSAPSSNAAAMAQAGTAQGQSYVSAPAPIYYAGNDPHNYVNPDTGILNPGYITPSTLAPVTPFPAVTAPTNPIYPVSTLTTPDTTLQPTPQETQASGLSTQLGSLYNDLVGKSAYQTQENTAYGVDAAQQNIQDLSAQLTGIKNEAAAIPMQLQQGAADRGVTTPQLGAQQNSRLRTNAIAALSVSTLLAASQGQLANAQSMADRAVAQRYDPILEQITATKTNLDLIMNDPLTTLADKNRALVQQQKQDALANQTATAKTNAKTIQDIAIQVAPYAPASVLNAISNAATVNDALIAAKGYLTDPLEAKYKQAQINSLNASAASRNVASGGVSGTPTNTPVAPVSYTVKPTDTGGLFQIAQDNGIDFAALKAANPQLGTDFTIKKGDVLHLPSTSNSTTGIEPTSQSILSQTGLSGNAFFWLTGRSSQLPRDQATRNAAAAEATAWANKNGVDISTLPAQYDAYNKVLSFNTVRQSMAVVQENEIQGTIGNLSAVAPDGKISGLNWANVTKIWAGQQVNDPIAQQYSFHLEQLRNEVVAYNLIAQGQVNTDGSLKQAQAADVVRAEQVIQGGVNSGSLEGLSNAVTNSTAKMKPILQTSLDAARQAVWNLFGVGDKFNSNPTMYGGATLPTSSNSINVGGYTLTMPTVK